MRSRQYTFPVKAAILWCLLSLVVNWALAQDTSSVNQQFQKSFAYLDWVSQYPSSETKSNPTIPKRIINFFFGKKEPTLSKPVSILAQDSENIWVLDQGNEAIIHIQNVNGTITAIEDKKLVTGVGLSTDEIHFSSLVGICALPSGEILFTDSRLNNIFHISPDNKEIRILNDSLTLKQPTGIAYSAERKEIWVVETKAHRISILTEKGELIKTIGTRGTGAGEFNYPTCIWIDHIGKAYIVDAMNFRIQVFDAEGVFVSKFGEVGDASGYLARPKGIATDSYGNIYVADALFHNIQIFDIEGNFLYRFGEQGHEKRQFWMPSGIFIDEKDQVYVADSYNSRIQVFQLVNGSIK